VKHPFSKYLKHSVKVTLRSQKIGIVSYRYGLAGALASLGIEVGRRGLSSAGILRASPVRFDAVFGKNLAKTFIKLGPTFIKLGQILATRPDLVGDPVAEQLKILFDRVPPVPFREIKSILKREIGKKNFKRWIRSIESKALASASLSQTHRAVLSDGTPVILKVQKNGVAETVRADLLILEGIIRSLQAVYPKLHLMPMFEEFRDGTLREIDYREEAKNIDRFRKNYRKVFSSADVDFPRYFPDLTTEKVIALEPMHGKKVTEIRKGTTVARKAASAGLTAVLEQIFDHGFFHADPHSGNLFFQQDEGRIGFIDLGLVGQLEPSDKRKFLKVLLAILKRDRERLAQALYDMGIPSPNTNYKKFEAEIQALLDDVKAKGIDNLRMDQLVNRVLTVARRNGVVIPNRYILMIRSCLIIEGVAKGLDPKISVFNIATPIVARSLMKSYNPLYYIKKIF
jgi:ubiquinone biosynthesis protein